MSTMTKWSYLYISVILGVLMLSLNDVAQASLLVDSSGSLKSLQSEVEALLPPALIKSLKLKAPQAGYRLGIKPLPRGAMGSSNKDGEIFLSPQLFKLNRLQQQRVLIHEWAHQFDFLNDHPIQRQKMLEWCRRWDPGAEHRRLNPSAAQKCDIYREIQSSVSSTPEFLEIAGWSLSSQGKGQRERQTHFTYRSLDLYEIQSPAEMFAVNMEYFLTDAEFACRRPTMAFYLSSYFGHQPFSQKDCSKDYRLVSPHFNSAEKALVSIDRDRLYQIHYLVADRGDGLAAKFGHSMFRFVMCAPHRKEMGPDCIKDIQHHFVLSYRAFIDSPQISYLAGLGGDYPSKLFFLPFVQVIEEYNKTELRDLKSYPLQLTTLEKFRVFDRAFEVHWSYNGQYYFLSKNCAVESFNLLRSSTLRPELLDRFSTTPFGMLDILTSTGLVKKGYFHDESWALANGYLFRSHAESLEKAFALIKNAGHGLGSVNSIGEWRLLGSVQRREIFTQTVSAVSQSEKVKMAAAFLLLENWIARTYSSQLMESLLAVIEKPELGSSANASVSQESSRLQSFLAAKMGFRSTEDLLTTPARLAMGGYGIPRPQEHFAMLPRFEIIAGQRSEMKEALSQLMEAILPSSLGSEELEIKKNREVFSQELLAHSKKIYP